MTELLKRLRNAIEPRGEHEKLIDTISAYHRLSGEDKDQFIVLIARQNMIIGARTHRDDYGDIDPEWQQIAEEHEAKQLDHILRLTKEDKVKVVQALNKYVEEEFKPFQ